MTFRHAQQVISESTNLGNEYGNPTDNCLSNKRLEFKIKCLVDKIKCLVDKIKRLGDKIKCLVVETNCLVVCTT